MCLFICVFVYVYLLFVFFLCLLFANISDTVQFSSFEPSLCYSIKFPPFSSGHSHTLQFFFLFESPSDATQFFRPSQISTFFRSKNLSFAMQFSFLSKKSIFYSTAPTFPRSIFCNTFITSFPKILLLLYNFYFSKNICSTVFPFFPKTRLQYNFPFLSENLSSEANIHLLQYIYFFLLPPVHLSISRDSRLTTSRSSLTDTPRPPHSDNLGLVSHRRPRRPGYYFHFHDGGPRRLARLGKTLRGTNWPASASGWVVAACWCWQRTAGAALHALLMGWLEGAFSGF